mmetsp:Transcript_21474/g.66992  ORF Transcript_21474/g.66992 Transcript_21474/m.66992 type:complete len:634 (+) Transcript_21474:1-1902(+)
MGEYEQPVVGLKSCFDLSEEECRGHTWRAREWYVVKNAGVTLSNDNVLAARVKMGVEARELSRGADGLEDARITRPDHPLVKYADAFTHYFDLIAERKSAVFHLRELAKASVLAKVLLEHGFELQDAWFEAAEEEAEGGRALEIPQLWNERSHCQIRVKDGKLVDVEEGVSTRRHGVYGGVQFGLEEAVGELSREPLFSAAALTEEAGQYVSFAALAGVVPPARKPRGVDLNLDSFDLPVPAPAQKETHSAEPFDPDTCVAFGQAFWSSLSYDSGSAFTAEDANLLRALFNPNLSDRRDEGDLFVPPDTSAAYLRSLRELLEEEDEVRQQRKRHFLSTDFELDDAGPLFPATFAASLAVATEQAGHRGHGAPTKDGWTPSSAQAAKLQQVLKSTAPLFSKSTEDGTQFRIYQVGRLEVRSTQEPGGQENVGAVFSGCPPMTTSNATDIVVKVTEYVEASEPGSPEAPHYYVMLETETGNSVITEKLRDGKVRWAANPKHLEARNALARVTGCTDCSSAGMSLRDIQTSEARCILANCDRRRYARGVYGLAQPACRKCWTALTDAQRQAARELGVPDAAGWDSRTAAAWGLQWWQLAEPERAAAVALGADADAWDELRRAPGDQEVGTRADVAP